MEELTLMQRGVRSIALPFVCLLALSACGAEDEETAKNYLLTIDPDLWVEPPSVGEDIGAFVPQFLLGVADDSSSPKITIATALDGAQNQCNATTEVTGPTSLITTEEFLLHVVHPRIDVTVDLTVHDLTFTNVMPGAERPEGELSVVMDINEGYVLFDLVPDEQRTPEGVCTVLGMAGVVCEACPFGDGGSHCLTLKAVQLAATETSVTPNPIAADERDPSCTP